MAPRSERRDAPIRLLCLASNPSRSSRLKLDEELRVIKSQLERASLRDRFEIIQQEAVLLEDLDRHLLHHKPHIVHFSGHGLSGVGAPRASAGRASRDLAEEGEEIDAEGGGLLLEDRQGRVRTVSGELLARLFAVLGGHTSCVVLNACYSGTQAQGIADAVGCVVGMSSAIDDEAAIAFASSFYMALGEGSSIKTAFELGRTQIELRSLPDASAPVLLTTPGHDPEVLEPSGGSAKTAAGDLGALFTLDPMPPRLGELFYGRQSLFGALSAGLASGGKVAIQGGSGAGKTCLAVEYAHRCRGLYPGGVFWIRADPSVRLAQLQRLLVEFDPSASRTTSLERGGLDIVQRLRAKLRQRAGASLWIIDDLPLPDATGQALTPSSFCPVYEDASVLLTTRWTLAERAIKTIDLEALDIDSAVALLTERLPFGCLTEAQARVVVNWVDHHPLALEMLGRSLSLGDLAPSVLLDAIWNGADRISELDALGTTRRWRPDGTPEAFSDVFSATWQSLSAEARRLASALALRELGPMPRALFEALDDNMAARPARAQLVERHILIHDQERATWHMPALQASYIRQQGPPHPKDLERLQLYLNPSPEEWVDTIAEHNHEDMAQLARVLEDLKTQPRPSRGADPPTFSKLSRPLPVTLPMVPSRPDRKTLLATRRPASPTEVLPQDNAMKIAPLSASLRALRRDMGPAHPRTVETLVELALAFHNAGEPTQARQLIEQGLPEALGVLGPRHPQITRAQWLLCQACDKLGDRASAEVVRHTLRWMNDASLDELDPIQRRVLKELTLDNITR